MRVDVEENGDVGVTGRWVDVWAAAVSINTICVGRRQAGVVRLPGGITVRLDRVYDPMSGDGSVSSNVMGSMATA